MEKRKIEVVAAVIFDEKKILVSQRDGGDMAGRWEFPGGKIEAGETHEQALKREIMEELGIIISVDSFLLTIEYDYPEFHLVMHCYQCAILFGAPRLLTHSAVKWISPQELDNIDWLPADIQVVDYLKKHLF
ncbi:MAG TPA: (deoxy)nucleoside triphosphate pyrophosphohydrolase [Bacteroidales bacterium]|nr:(deoxy)nucleoside triphosphate pyrophosphohydrolase [Bacteroidales bacterium]HPK30204.1 (deoxy)nucleoside triphosphate pyrophosphohydrolase [Bacteroidales bacterium]